MEMKDTFCVAQKSLTEAVQQNVSRLGALSPNSFVSFLCKASNVINFLTLTKLMPDEFFRPNEESADHCLLQPSSGFFLPPSILSSFSSCFHLLIKYEQIL